MGLNIKYGTGETPIYDDEKEDLIPFWVSNLADLNEMEQHSIGKVLIFFEKRHVSVEKILTLSFVKYLHKKMFEEVWKWAGFLRKTNKNIGIGKELIVTSLCELLDDVKYWLQYNVYSMDEIAVRCKHRMVFIHPFVNGNGRHSRIFADILIKKLGKKAFSWGKSKLKPRETYLKALREADMGDYALLLSFARE